MNSRLLSLIAIILLTACSKVTENKSYYEIVINESHGGSTDFNSGIYEEGTELIIKALPDPGYRFKMWEGIESTSQYVNINVEMSLSIKPIFELDVIYKNENVPHLVEDLVDSSGYIFAIENGQKSCYLIDHNGNQINRWDFDLNLGQDIEISKDGNLIGLFKVSDPNITFGGQGGIIRKISKEGNTIWEYRISDENEIAHHDIELLPNGNILALVWTRIDKQIANEVGFMSDGDVFIEKIKEINPTTNEVVWVWNSWDHIVQNANNNLSNYGVISEKTEKINILYNNNSTGHPFIPQGDIMHANGIEYIEDLDLIVLSVNFYNEVWFIDHSTTQIEANSSSGGNFNKGGDLIYRIGNSKTYNNDGTSTFDFNHHPSINKVDNNYQLLIFNNNNKDGVSRIMEFKLPDFNSTLSPTTNAELILDFTDENLFFPRVGGAQRLPNGNTLICEGDYGFWEINNNKEVVWKYDGLGKSFWRSLFYSKDSPEIINILN